MHRAVDFCQGFCIETCTLKMPVDIGGKDEGAGGHSLRPGKHDLKACVWLRGAVEIQTMSVKAPGQRRISREPARVRDRHEVQAELFIRRIGAPKSLRAAKIRQTRVDSHAGAGADQKSVGLPDRFSGSLQFWLVRHMCVPGGV